MELDELRRRIDDIDSQIIDLYTQRMGLSREIAQVKLRTRQTIHNPRRESDIVKRAVELSGDQADPVRLTAFYRALMRQSRGLQYEVASERRELDFLCDKPIRVPVSPQRVACAGLPGSYTHMAAERLYPKAEKLFMQTFEEVLGAVADGLCNCGVLPIDNTTEGSISDVQEGVVRHHMYLTASVALPVRHCLLAPPGATAEGLREVYSHPQALGQCAAYLRRLGVLSKADVNTSVAAERVARWGDTSKGAVASHLSAELYGLDILDENINDEAENTTRFVAVSPVPLVSPDAGRISLSFTLPHETGSLVNILSAVSEYGLGLVKVQSVPIPQRPWKYRFYVDVLGNIYSPKAKALLYMLFCELEDICFLGNYCEETAAEGGEGKDKP